MLSERFPLAARKPPLVSHTDYHPYHLENRAQLNLSTLPQARPIYCLRLDKPSYSCCLENDLATELGQRLAKLVLQPRPDLTSVSLASFQDCNLEKNGPIPWDICIVKRHLDVTISNGSGIRKPSFELLPIEVMRTESTPLGARCGGRAPVAGLLLLLSLLC